MHLIRMLGINLYFIQNVTSINFFRCLEEFFHMYEYVILADKHFLPDQLQQDEESMGLPLNDEMCL